MNWDGYAKFYDWEFRLICTDQREDIRIWKKLTDEFDGNILELCCGSGRITEVLANKGHRITALDNSEEMLDILKQKQLENVTVVQADMTDFSLDRKFGFIFISYSSFQQLLSLTEQQNCLQSIRNHLEDNGVLALDISPFVCEGLTILPKTHLFTADYPAGNSTVSMYTSHQIDRIEHIKHWNDEYLEVDKDGNEKVYYNKISLKEMDKSYLKLLLENCGFEIDKIYGDFDGGEVTEYSKNLIYIVKKVLP